MSTGGRVMEKFNRLSTNLRESRAALACAASDQVLSANLIR